MITTIKHELKTLLFIAVAFVVSIVIISQRNNRLGEHVFSATLPSFPVVTPTPDTPVQTEKMDSPDGSKILTLEKKRTNNSSDNSFFVSSPDTEKKLVFKKTENLTQNFSVPYNSWSPDNSEFFLKETTPARNNYLVFRATGANFSNNDQYINIQDVFVQKLPNYTIEDVTGWAAPDLVIVNTKNDKGDEGPSFWFVVSSQSFLQLGTHFN